jgi:hypothetical protein
VTRKGVVFSGSAADIRALRTRFQRDHYIILPKLIEPDLLATILKRIEAAPSVKKEYDGIIAESIIDDPLTYNLFLFLLGIPEFQLLVQRITGSRRIANFKGRIYRLNPTTGDRIVWHTDSCDHRMLTFSLNLAAGLCKSGIVARRKFCTKFATQGRVTLFSCALRTSCSIASSPSRGMFPEPLWRDGFAGKREI